MVVVSLHIGIPEASGSSAQMWCSKLAVTRQVHRDGVEAGSRGDPSRDAPDPRKYRTTQSLLKKTAFSFSPEIIHENRKTKGLIDT